jgi:hypothetical protein
MLDGDATPPAVPQPTPFDSPDAGGLADAVDPLLDDAPVATIDPPVDDVDPGSDHDEDWSEGDAPPTTWSGRQEPWSLLALVAAVIGAIPVTWGVPILSLAAVAFALVGLHHCDLDRARPNRWMAVVALCVGLLSLIGAMVGTGLGRIEFLPFWTNQ